MHWLGLLGGIIASFVIVGGVWRRLARTYPDEFAEVMSLGLALVLLVSLWSWFTSRL